MELPILVANVRPSTADGDISAAVSEWSGWLAPYVADSERQARAAQLATDQLRLMHMCASRHVDPGDHVGGAPCVEISSTLRVAGMKLRIVLQLVSEDHVTTTTT